MLWSAQVAAAPVCSWGVPVVTAWILQWKTGCKISIQHFKRSTKKETGYSKENTENTREHLFMAIYLKYHSEPREMYNSILRQFLESKHWICPRVLNQHVNKCCFCEMGVAEDGAELSVAPRCVRRGYEFSLAPCSNQMVPWSLKFVCPSFDFLNSFAGVSDPKITTTQFYCLVYRWAKPHTQAPIRFLQNKNPDLNPLFFSQQAWSLPASLAPAGAPRFKCY